MAVSASKRIIGAKAYYNVVRRVAFPSSTNAIVLTSLLFATVGIGTSFVIARGSALSFFEGASWGIAILVLPSFVSNIMLYPVIMKQDPLFYLRRCLAFSLFTVSTWVIVFLVSILALLVPDFVFPGFAVIVGLFAVMPIRSVVVFAMSKTSFARRMLFTLTEPTLTAVSAILVFGTVAGGVMVGLVLSSLSGLAFAFIIITVVELDGRRTVAFCRSVCFEPS